MRCWSEACPKEPPYRHNCAWHLSRQITEKTSLNLGPKLLIVEASTDTGLLDFSRQAVCTPQNIAQTRLPIRLVVTDNCHHSRTGSCLFWHMRIHGRFFNAWPATKLRIILQYRQLSNGPGWSPASCSSPYVWDIITSLSRAVDHLLPRCGKDSIFSVLVFNDWLVNVRSTTFEQVSTQLRYNFSS